MQNGPRAMRQANKALSTRHGRLFPAGVANPPQAGAGHDRRWQDDDSVIGAGPKTGKY
jgi:hypothetical protein